MKLELRWTPFLMLLYREIRRFNKVFVQTVFAPLITSSLYLLIFGMSIGKQIQMDKVSYLAFLIPGLVMMACLNNAFQNSTSSIISSKFGGDLEDLKAAPLSRIQLVWAYGLGGFIRGFTVAFVTYLVGMVFYYIEQGQVLSLHNPFLLFYFLFAGGVAFSHLGVIVAFWARTTDQLSVIGTFVVTPLIYLGGVFFSLENLSPFWQNLSHWNPLFYLINGVRYGILGISDVSILLAAIVSLVTVVLFQWISWVTLGKCSYSRW